MGVVVLVFLGWAWARSNKWEEGVAWQIDADSIVQISQSKGRVLVGGSGHSELGSGQVIEFSQHRVAEGLEGLSTIVVVEKIEFGLNGIIAHWFLILLFLIPWSGFLIWRTRRERLAFREITIPPSSQGDAS